MGDQLESLRSDVREAFEKIKEIKLPDLPKLPTVNLNLPKLPESNFNLKESFAGVESQFEGIEIFETLEKQTGLPKFVLAGGIVVFAVVFTALSFYVTFLGLFTSRFLGVAYPVHASFKAIESDNKDDDTQWLTYWVVFSFFSIFEMIALGVLKENNSVGATYFLIKVLFLAWCQFGKGAYYMYKAFVKPFVIAGNALQEQADKWFESYIERRGKRKAHED